MEDEQFKESASRHHCVTLCRLNGIGDFSSGQSVTLYSSSPSVVRSHDLNSLITRGESADDFLDGHNKHVNGILINSDYEHQPLVQTSNSPVSRYHFQRTRSPGLQVSSKDRVKGGGGFGFSLTAAEARMLLAGGLTTLLKIGALLLTRAFCGNLWPYLQVFSICSLSIDPLKLLVPKARKIPIAPLKGLAGPVLYITVARPIVRWGLPDAYRTAQFWRRLLPIYLGAPSSLFHDPTDIDLRSGEAEVPIKSAAGILLPRYVIPWISANMGPANDPELLYALKALGLPENRYMKTKYGTRGKSREDKDKSWATRHEWGGDRVHRLVLDLSGFYVKSAQILATKADFVPEPWIRRLSNHLDNAPPRPFPEVEESIRQQLERCPGRSALITDGQGLVKLNAAFAVVEEKCIAAASIAQVHGAELKDGNRVVIKVQHLGMEVIMKSDLRNIVWVARFLEGQLPFDLGPVVREIQKTIPLEFDFEREVWFMTTIKKNLEKGGFDLIVCPEPVLDLCATRLLVMQRLEGIPFTRILHPQASAELKGRIPEVVSNVEYLVSAYGQMLLQDGVFHADPHAGNLLLLSDGRLGLIDFGQSKVLEPGLRKLLAQMIVALGNNSDEEIASALHNLGMRFENANGRDVETSTLALMARILFDTCHVHEATVSPMAEESILRRTPLTTFNQSLWLVVRAMVLLRGLCYGLNMDLSSCTLWRSYALRALEEQGGDPVGGKWA